MPNQLNVNFDIVKEDWGKLDGFGLYFHVANLVWSSFRDKEAEISIRLTDKLEMRTLNKKWRDRDAETNVLAFPNFKERFHNEVLYIGDLLIGYETVLYEADISNIPLVNHMSHLIIHGVLHLLEFNHESKEAEAKMQKIEKNILKSVGIPDPYIVNQGS